MEHTINSSDLIITANDLNLWYDQGKPTEVHALKNINVDIIRGDYVAFFGPSGCGKTTMLYAITGIDSYQSGKVLINNTDLTGLTSLDLAYFRQTEIGIVFQQFNLVSSLTVLQNVALPMIFRGMSSSEANIRAKNLIERLALGKYINRYPFELSGGQQQRVAIARAISNDPPIIIADEPLGNLDSVNAKNVLAFLKELNEKDGRTIIMVTHEAWSLQDVKTVFYMKDGEITSKDHQEAGSGAAGVMKHLKKEMAGVGKSEEENEGGGLENEILSARAIANFLLRGYSFDEIERFEGFLLKRLQGKLSDKVFYNELHKSFNKGGVGLWKDKAKRVSLYVRDIVKTKKSLASIYKVLESNPELSIKDEIQKIRNWLLEDSTRTKLDRAQIESLDEAIGDRLRGNISQEDFAKIISLPITKFGVGFSTHTGLVLSQKMEVLLSYDAEAEEYDDEDDNVKQENNSELKEMVDIKPSKISKPKTKKVVEKEK